MSDCTLVQPVQSADQLTHVREGHKLRVRFTLTHECKQQWSLDTEMINNIYYNIRSIFIYFYSQFHYNRVHSQTGCIFK